jgi:hypothetical protein
MAGKHLLKLIVVLAILTASLLWGQPSVHAADNHAIATGDWDVASTWSLGAVPVSGDHAFIDGGFTVTIPLGYIVDNIDIDVASGATLINYGTIQNTQDTSAPILNNGTITNHNLIAAIDSIQVINGGILGNYATINDSNLTIGTLTLAGQLNNYYSDGSITFSTGTSLQVGAMGTVNNGAMIDTAGSGTITVEGLLDNFGWLNNDGNSFIGNDGTFDNNGNGTIENNGTFTVKANASLNSSNVIENYLGATFIIEGSGSVSSLGIFHNDGTLTNQVNGFIGNDGTFTNQANGFIGNDGTFQNTDTLENDNNITNGATGVITNAATGIINNNANGFIGNDGTFTNDGTVNNNTCAGADIDENNPIGGNAVNYIECTPTPTSTGTITATFTYTPTDTPTATFTPSATTCTLVATPPTLISPAHRAHVTDTTPGFSWSNSSGATSYRLMIYTADRSFEYKKRTFNTSYTLTAGEALAVGTYQWRVRTQDTICTTWTTWSKRNTLFVD